MLIDTIQFQDYTIELYRENLRLFEGEFAKYYCSILVLNKLGTELCNIKTTDIEIANLLDNIYFYFGYDEDTTYTFAMNDKAITYAIGFRNSKDQDNTNSYMDIYSGILVDNYNNNMHKICSICITERIYEIVAKLYNSYIINSDMDYDTIFEINPENYGIFM